MRLLALILLCFTSAAWANSPKMGRVLKMEDVQTCKIEAGIAKGAVILHRDGLSKENVFVMLSDHYGFGKEETITRILADLDKWNITKGDDAEMIFEALCYWALIGPIDVIDQ